MLRTRIALSIALLVLLGCQDKNSARRTAYWNSPDPLDVETLDASPTAKEFLIRLESLFDTYEREGSVQELNEFGVKGNMPENQAALLAKKANKILDKINELFNTPVCKSIGESWYQVPSRFVVSIAPDSNDDNQTTSRFTISHHNCGLYEYDFEISEDGHGQVVTERYDSLGIAW